MLPTVIRTMRDSIESICRWFIVNGLKMNASKIQLIVLVTRQRLQRLQRLQPYAIQIAIGGESVVVVPVVKNLGVAFDQHLSWIPHVDVVVQKTATTLMRLSHKRHILPKDVITNVVEASVIAYPMFCTA